MSLLKFYTSEYEGEMVTDSLRWRDGNKTENGTWTPKTIINEDPQGCAFVIGNGPSRLKHNLELFKGQHGGVQIESVGQSYGCNMLYTDFVSTFLICTNLEIAESISKTDYAENNIVYSNRKCILKYPGLFHLYPHHQPLFSGPAAMRLACADGHTKVFMVGFDLYNETTNHLYPQMRTSYQPITDPAIINSKLITQMCTIFDLYDEVEFFHVQSDHSHYNENIVEQFNWHHNVKTIGIMEFMNLANLGAVHK